jgi:radical SAM protein with 4Fe4S-binding SPASM domain
MRVINTLQCLWSYLLSLVGVVRVHHLPTFVSVEPANYCQLRCPECPVGQRLRADNKAKHMSLELFSSVLEQVGKTAHTMQFYFQGEPLLHPELPKMIAAAHAVGLYTIVSTNAQALTAELADALVRSGLNRIIVSIDGFSQDSYASYRVGGRLEKALAGLRYLAEARQRSHARICIELQVLRLHTNENEWQWIRRHYRELGATRLVFKTAQLYDYQHGHALMPSNPHYSRYRKTKEGTYRLHRSWIRRYWINTPCYRLWSGCVVTAEGEVLPCCYDKMGQHTFGSLSHTALEALWHGEKANAFRLRVINNGNSIPMCKECDH